jgi:tyrosyl-tRNA synthetase
MIASDEAIWLPKLLLDAGLVKSTSDGRRMIQQQAVAIDGEKVTDSNCAVPAQGTRLFKVGKRRFCRITFSA